MFIFAPDRITNEQIHRDIPAQRERERKKKEANFACAVEQMALLIRFPGACLPSTIQIQRGPGD